MTVLDDLGVVRRPWRPPTAVYPDRHQMAQVRDENFPPTAWALPTVFDINLEGGFFAPGALKDLILPLAQAVRSGLYGRAVLLVQTSDDGIVEFLESLAERYGLSMFIVPSHDAPLTAARPVGAVTRAEVQALELLCRSGGEVTSSAFAELAGVEINAAVNRLSSLAKKGYIYRVPRSRREGDVYVDPRVAAQASSSHKAAIPAAGRDFEIPEDVRAGAQMLAAMEGTHPRDVLARAWHEFLVHHRETLEAESKEVGQMIQKGDIEGLASYANRYVRPKAQAPADRLKD